MTQSPFRENIFFNGYDYFESLLKDIKTAEKSIDLEAYIFDSDKLGKRIISALKDASHRGVAIRVMVDGAGSPQWGGSLVRSLETSGAKTRIFHPFPWRLWQWSRSFVRVPSILKAIYLLLKINSRNHRKTCIIDKKVAYIGSFNICQRHLGREHDGDGWRDTGVRLSGANLNAIEDAFDTAWDNLTIQERLRTIFKHISTNPSFRLNNTWHRRRILHKNLLKRMTRCKKRIWITNAYFVPDNFLLKKLADAARRRIDVRILLPKTSDVAFMPWASNAFYESLLKAGVRIFEYLPSILHAKTLILDDWMLIGSSNLNHRSLLHDFEVDVNIRLPESKEILVKQFLLDLEQTREVKLDNWRISNFYQRIVGKLALYIKYMI